ncbi:signal recognition particle protein [Marinilactibacillus psychrotolerans]|uniref:Signal recognition particle protein n=1 Tax=Marinilactibacillus psychrotolerans TaxID=191770 RepID=A0A5R9C6H0_9LACT|nr:signal recognition particle protein [Marinilactibacillus psychrotolerans]TLQ08692.1 signal recognition particle protein [Marinilactibacillus psychrotolerans]GEQ33166.1 signal recognition particle protein [Marinilactibacillus psychrotolerans]
MAFEGLTGRLQDAFSGLRKKGKITEADVKDAMREVRLALLEADVNYKVVREFVKTVREKAIGEEVLESINGGQQVVKIVNDELTHLMGGTQEKIIFADRGPTVYMMTGLQGAGKTTTAGKLANYLRKQENKKPMLVAADIYRPAAIDQLQTVGSDLNIPVFSMGDQVSPVEIAEKGIQEAKNTNRDVVIIDTAGRLHIDETLMDELENVKTAVNPHEIFLVVDAMTGQDAVNVANTFNDRLDITSVILTKLDGDTRGGAALSIRSVTQKPIKFTGTGERLDALEPFHPDRMANRILGMGDILTLVERAQQEVDEKKAEEMAVKMRENTYDFNDFIDQMDQMQNMGPMEDLLKMIPGVNQIPGMDQFEMDPKDMAHMKAIVMSMTPEERANPDLLSQKRRRRIAKGSARNIAEVNRMIKQFKQSKEMMSKMSNGNMSGMENLFGGGVKGKLGKMAFNKASKNLNKKKKKKIRRKK